VHTPQSATPGGVTVTHRNRSGTSA
jgi:hypothetical protein